MPNPCGPCSDSPDSFRTMRLYLGRFFFAALLSALLLGVLFAAMSLRDERSQKLRNCNKHPRRVAHDRENASGHGMLPVSARYKTESNKKKAPQLKPGRLK